jgi:hypothetical protein
VFGAISVTLKVIGIFGVMAQAVGQRANEIAVRMAARCAVVERARTRAPSGTHAHCELPPGSPRAEGGADCGVARRLTRSG